MPTMTGIESAFCRSAPWRAFTRRVVLPWALQGCVPSGDVLEIGSGSGAMAAELLEAFPNARVTATDFDPAMVDTARSRLARFGGRAAVQPADASALPFADGSFEMVLSFIMLHHTVEWERVLDEVARVLRPGGWLVGYDLLDRAPARLAHRLEGQPFLRMVSIPALRARLTSLPFDEVTLRRSGAGLVVRIRARRR
jgi:ubiquinone/menaquinone biosynthesis C-methylase UbiE